MTHLFSFPKTWKSNVSPTPEKVCREKKKNSDVLVSTHFQMCNPIASTDNKPKMDDSHHISNVQTGVYKNLNDTVTSNENGNINFTNNGRKQEAGVLDCSLQDISIPSTSINSCSSLQNGKTSLDDGLDSGPDYRMNKYTALLSNEPEEVEIQVSDENIEIVKKLFPKPRKVLQALYDSVVKKLQAPKYKITQKSFKISRTAGPETYKCVIHIKWPNKVCFSGKGETKPSAADTAALKALHWLRRSERITDNGRLGDYKDQNGEHMPARVFIDESALTELEIVLEWFHREIEDLLELKEEVLQPNVSTRSDNEDNTSSGRDEKADIAHPITGRSSCDATDEDFMKRNNDLYEALIRRGKYHGTSIKNKIASLPITPWKTKICNLINENRVVVVKGETGCGKSTQVPQFIMDEWIHQRRGAHCNIIVTQPRRLSAQSLAKRVVQERKEILGDVVGYQIRFEFAPPKPPGGAILFCSTGILLLRLKMNPGLVGLSHVVLDEAHERDVNIDILMVLLRRALKLNDKLKIIVMSATINAEQFQKYFPVAVCIHIPGFAFPVTSYFLEDLVIPGLRLKNTMSCLATPRMYLDDIINVVMWIDQNKSAGAILVFLPGWAEIRGVRRLLEEKMDPDTTCILPVHSRLPYEEQNMIFNSVAKGTRKIILATNIAETSITINDVRYVVDTGAHKEKRLNTLTGLSFLDNHWISQASVNQRKGRAGRIQEGECYHLYTKERYETMDPFPIPEVLRVPLEKIVLDCKFFSENEKAIKFLSEMPDSPSEDATQQAILFLVELGALNPDEKLTDLGRRIASFTTHPRISKALVHSTILKCVSPVATASSVLANSTEMFNCSLNERDLTRKSKNIFHPTSDHVSIAWMYQQWETLFSTSKTQANKFCVEMCLRKENVEVTKKLRRILTEHLYDSGMLEDVDSYEDLSADCNLYAGNDELTKGVHLSGWNNIIVEKKWGMRRGQFNDNDNTVFITQSGHRTFISPDSVNFMRSNFNSPFLIYYFLTNSLEKRAMVTWDTSVISPLTLLLFKEGRVSIRKISCDDTASDIILNLGDGLELTCDKSEAPLLLEIRAVLKRILNYFISNEGIRHDDKFKVVCSFRDRFLQVLSKILHKASFMTELAPSKLGDDEYELDNFSRF